MITNPGESITASLSAEKPVSLVDALLKKFGLHMLALLFICSLVYCITGYVYYKTTLPRGDEPHYLMITQTLLKYHSLDLLRDYHNKDYQSFFPGNLPPHLAYNKRGQALPLHGIGGPILWLIPFALFGRKGAIGFNVVVSILTVLNIYWLLLIMGIKKQCAFLVGLAFALGSPIYLYSHLTFIEPIGALLCIYVVRIIFQPQRSAAQLVCASTALGMLPWLHIRFAQIELVLFLFMLYCLYREQGFTDLKQYAYLLVPVLLFFLAFEIYNLVVWGSLNPAANEFDSGNVPFHNSPFVGLVGITFDQEFGLFTNFPYLVFAIPGVILALRKPFARFNILMLLLFVPYVLVFTTFHDWAGGMCPPERYILVLTPLLAFYVAFALQSANSKILNFLCAVFLLFAFVLGMVYIGAPGNGFNHGTGRSLAMRHLSSIINFNITPYFPSLYQHHQRLLFLEWLIAALVLTAITVAIALLARRKRPAMPHLN